MKRDAVAHGLAAVRHEAELLLGEPGRHRVAADGAAFLVGEEDHLERMPQRDAALSEPLGHFDRAHRADLAVEAPALRHRVDVRADRERREGGVGAGAAADDVAGRVDADLELRRAHEAHRVLAALPVGVGVGDAMRAALRRRADLREFGEMRVQPIAVDASNRILSRKESREPPPEPQPNEIDSFFNNFFSSLVLDLVASATLVHSSR